MDYERKLRASIARLTPDAQRRFALSVYERYKTPEQGADHQAIEATIVRAAESGDAGRMRSAHHGFKTSGMLPSLHLWSALCHPDAEQAAIATALKAIWCALDVTEWDKRVRDIMALLSES